MKPQQSPATSFMSGVHIGTPYAKHPEWRNAKPEEDMDDEPLSESPKDIAAVLGFDPRELFDDDGNVRGQETQESVEWVDDDVTEAQWDETKHKRGNPHNKGQFAPKGSAGGGVTVGSDSEKPTFDRQKWLSTENRRDVWKGMHYRDRDKQAQATKTIPARAKEHLSGLPEQPNTGDLRADLSTRIGHFSDRITPRSQKLMLQAIGGYERALERAGVGDKARRMLAMTAADMLAAQEVEGMGRQLGDHGVHHIQGNIKQAMDILAVVPGGGNPHDRALAMTALMFHDVGYMTPPSQVFLDEGHHRWSAQWFNTTLGKTVDEALGEGSAHEIAVMIATHDSTDVSWREDPVGSAIRVADNTSLFHQEKLPPVFREVPGTLEVLEKLGAKQIDEKGAQAQIKALVQKSDLSPKVKQRMTAAADEVSAFTSKATLGMMGGELSRVTWDQDHLTIHLKPSAEITRLNEIGDFGQRQFGKFAEAYGVDPKQFTKSLYFTFKGSDGKPILAGVVDKGSHGKRSLESIDWEHDTLEDEEFERKHPRDEDGQFIKVEEHGDGTFSVRGKKFDSKDDAKEYAQELGQEAREKKATKEEPKAAKPDDDEEDPPRFGTRNLPAEAEVNDDLVERLRAVPSMKDATIERNGDVVTVTTAAGTARVRFGTEEEFEEMAASHPERLAESRAASGGGMTVAGYYRGGELVLRRDATAGEISHEHVHFLRDVGVITHDDVALFGGEEQLAVAYGNWVQSNKPRDGIFGKLADVFDRIWDFFAGLFSSEAHQRSVLRDIRDGRVTESWAPMGGGLVKGGLRYPAVPWSTEPHFGLRTLDGWAEVFREDARKLVDKSGKRLFSDEEIEQQLAAVRTTAAIWAAHPEVRPMEDEGDMNWGPVTKNGDYIYSIDFDTFCPKNERFYAILKAIQQKAGRILTNKESAHLMLYMKGLELMTPCTYCYVENQRRAQREALADVSQARMKIFQYLDENGPPADVEKGSADPVYQALGEMMHGDRKENLRSMKKDGSLPKSDSIRKAREKAEKLEKLEKALAAETNQKKRAKLEKELAKARESGVPSKHETLKAWVDEWKQDKKEGRDHAFVGEELFINEDVKKNHLADSRVAAFIKTAETHARGAAHAKALYGYQEYDGQLRKISDEDKIAVNARAGLRFLSNTDMKVEHLLDWQQLVMDMAVGGWKAHAYTKDVRILEIFGGTGIKFNMSLALDGRDPDKFSVDAQHSIDWAAGMKYREKYPDNVGSMLMVKNLQQLQWALKNDDIDMIIPFHRSGMRRDLINALDWDDFEDVQQEEWDVKKFGSAEKARQHAIAAGAKLEKGKPPHFVDFGNPAHGIDGHENDKDKYFAACEKYGVLPRFYKVTLPNGMRVIDHPNYMKLVRDVAAKPDKQDVVKPHINFEAIKREMDNFAATGGFAKDREANDAVVDKFVDHYLKGVDRPLGDMPQNVKDMQEIQGQKTLANNRRPLARYDGLFDLADNPRAPREFTPRPTDKPWYPPGRPVPKEPKPRKPKAEKKPAKSKKKDATPPMAVAESDRSWAKRSR